VPSIFSRIIAGELPGKFVWRDDRAVAFLSIAPMMPGQMIVGFINGVLSAMLAAWLLSRSTAASSTYFSRVAFCGALGIFASLVTHVVSWNWMGYPIGYTTGLITDAVVGWMLAGLGIGTIIKGGAA
jgi:hypothetical protein